MKKRKRERGAALVLTVFAAAMVLLLLTTIQIMTWGSSRFLVRQLQSQGRALSAANAGLVETLSWFIHQRQQPVLAFDPKQDEDGVCTHVPKHNPLVYESEEPDIGIVRSFEISGRGKVWGRYEVRRTAVEDVSTRRGKPAAGTTWELESEGLVYVRNDQDKEPGQSPNFVIARRTMRVDIQRLALQFPANAALSSLRADNVNVIKPSRIQGGAAGIGVAYKPGSGSTKGNGTITGSPAKNTTGGEFALDQVFGVTQNELLAMADIVVDDERDLPDPLPNMKLIVVRGNAAFNSTKKLTGSGILVVLGNLILNPQSDTYFSGVIWVGGTFNMAPPGIINGTVIANGTAQISGGADVAEINYDQDILDQVRLQLGNYLFSRSPWIVEARLP